MTQKKPLLTTDITGVRDRVSEAEWQERVNLAACYHLVAHFGWTDLIYTHISARAPDEEGVFLLNPFGFLFDEITASSLIKVDIDGNPVDDHGFEMHRAGFVKNMGYCPLANTPNCSTIASDITATKV